MEKESEEKGKYGKNEKKEVQGGVEVGGGEGGGEGGEEGGGGGGGGVGDVEQEQQYKSVTLEQCNAAEGSQRIKYKTAITTVNISWGGSSSMPSLLKILLYVFNI